jgi:histidinol dehydrogenase
MLAVPAKVAGCKELVICTPPNPSVELLYVLSLFDAKVFLVGGAQAIAAMAFGTETVPQVDKIFGPGNSYVTEAKMQVTRLCVPIDMPAGPSEVLIIADESAIPSFVAADLLSQAEHGEDSQVILISTSKRVLKESLNEADSQLQTLPRKDIAQKCLENSVAILVDSVSQAVEISNNYAPEHLILAIGNANEIVNTITNAGSVFVGNYSPESVGDYTSGTNHTLPTNGFSRNWSGVNLLSFYKTITLQQLSFNGLNALANATVTLARAEGLEAHARAVEVRIERK